MWPGAVGARLGWILAGRRRIAAPCVTPCLNRNLPRVLTRNSVPLQWRFLCRNKLPRRASVHSGLPFTDRPPPLSRRMSRAQRKEATHRPRQARGGGEERRGEERRREERRGEDRSCAEPTIRDRTPGPRLFKRALPRNRQFVHARSLTYKRARAHQP